MSRVPAELVSPRPTRVRHLVVALTTLMAFLLYLDRFCLSLPERYIKQDVGLNDFKVSLLFSAFFFAYALGQVPAGWLSDRFGSRQMLTLYILLWSLFTGFMGLAMSFAMLLALRLGCGLAQAGAYPTGAGIISKWVVFSARGRASAMVSVGGRLGGVAASILTAYLIIACVPANTPELLGADDIFDEQVVLRELATPGKGGAAELRGILFAKLHDPTSAPQDLMDRVRLSENLNRLMADPGVFANVRLDDVSLEDAGRKLAAIPLAKRTPAQALQLNRFLLEAALPDQVRKYYAAGWRPVMIVYGLSGVLVAFAFWLGVRSRPREHPLCNVAEIELIENSLPATVADPHGKVGALPAGALLRHVPLWFCSIVQLFGNFAWTFLVTYVPRYFDEVYHVPVVERGWMSGFPIFAGMFGMFSGGLITDWAARRFGVRRGRMLPIMLTRFVAAAAFFTCLVLHSPWLVTIALAVVAMATDLGTPAGWAYVQDIGGRHAGSVLGWSNMWGNFGSAITAPLLNWIAVSYGWDAVFTTCGVAFIIAGLLSFGIDATVPLFSPEADAITKAK